MKKTILLITLAFGMIAGYANNLIISNVTKVDESTLTFDVSWDNSWDLGVYHDGAYVFAKYKNPSGRWEHLKLINGSNVNPSPYTSHSVLNGNGMIVFGNNNLGTKTATVTFKFDYSVVGPLPDFKVFGIEVVNVAQGAYYLGDGVSQLRYYQGNDNTKPYYVQSENTITYGTTSNDINGGGVSQDIPGTFPKGYNSFYMMKYEITQEQYAEFLNTLTFDQQQTRTESDLNAITTPTYVMTNTTTVTNRNGIKSDGSSFANEIHTFYCDLNGNNIPNEADDGQNIACNFLSVNDILAYLDWAGIRPMNSLEFEKACRGTAYPIANENAMGTNIAPQIVTGIINSGANNEKAVNSPGIIGISNINFAAGPIRVGCFAGTSTNRVDSGATFYGAMNMQGNLYEVVVSADESSFTNTLGDGILDAAGNNTLWTNLTEMIIKTNVFNDLILYYRPISYNLTGVGDFNNRSNHYNIRGVISW